MTPLAERTCFSQVIQYLISAPRFYCVPYGELRGGLCLPGIQRAYGPFDRDTGEPNAEWKLIDAAAIAEQLPSALPLLAATADTVLAPLTSGATDWPRVVR